MDDKIKWALLAVGAYFLYDWYSKQVGPGGSDKYSKMCLPELRNAYASASAEDKAVIQTIVGKYKEPVETLAAMAAKGDCLAQGFLAEDQAQIAANPSPFTGGNIIALPESPVPVTPLPPWTRPVYTPPAVTPEQQAGLTLLSDALIAQVAVSGAAGSDLAIAESVRRNQRYDFHQWNYFRALTLGEQPDPASYYGGNAGDRVTAAEYMLVRKTALVTGIVQGMTGLGRHGGPILPWSTAWQA